MASMNDLSPLVNDPMERLNVEYKSWLDLGKPHGRATVAKHAIALANHGGGYIVIGFAESGEYATLESEPCPADFPAMTPDAVNSAVGRYAEPEFQCEMQLVMHNETGVHHPVIIVPGGFTEPVMSKRECEGVIRLHRCYIRKPGPRSQEPTTQSEWRALINRCVRASRDEMLDAMRQIVTGQVDAPANPTTVADKLSDFCIAARGRWADLAESTPQDDDARFRHGYYEIGLSFAGAIPAENLSQVKEKIANAGHSIVTGWPPFLILQSPEWEPRPSDGFVESWLWNPVANRLPLAKVSTCDFWRASREGNLYTIRGYTEDDGVAPSYGEPGSAMEVIMPIWRIGETLLFAGRLAQSFDGTEQVAIQCRFTGLRGRRLVSATLGRVPHIRFVSHTDEVLMNIEVTVQQLQDNLAEVVHNLLAPLYEAFNFYDMPIHTVQAELSRMRNNRWR